MTFSMASRQLAAFHQPVVFHKPLPLYQLCSADAARSVLALKSSIGPIAASELRPLLHARASADNVISRRQIFDSETSPIFYQLPRRRAGEKPRSARPGPAEK